MKKALILVSVLFLNFANAEISFEETKVLQTVPMGNSFALILEDSSIWELFTFELRSRTWTEWWHGVQIRMDEDLLWKGKDWVIYDNIIISNNDIDGLIMDSFNEFDRINYRKYPYILRNVVSNKIAFARPLTVNGLTQRLLIFSEKMYQKGYNSGISIGYLDGYNKGHSSGYSEGYSDGYSDGCE